MRENLQINAPSRHHSITPPLHRSIIPAFLCVAVLLACLLDCFAQRQPDDRPPPLDPIEGQRQARLLVANLLAQLPEQPLTNQGVLKIQEAGGKERDLPLTIRVLPTSSNWLSIYEIATNNGPSTGTCLTVIHNGSHPNQYHLIEPGLNGDPATRTLTGIQVMVPFAGSDFWLSDLGLEFLHWPEQRVLKKEMRRSQSCNVLESTAPQPAPEGCARIVSWIDIDTGGIVHADAYNSHNEVVRKFEPTKFKKINGQWQLEEVEMRNRKSGSRTWIEFNVKAK